MPFKSEAQRRYFYAANRRGEISDADLKKWEDETPDKKLPERLSKKAFMEGFEKRALTINTVKNFPLYGGLGLGGIGAASGYAGAGNAKTVHREVYNEWKKDYLKKNPGASKDKIDKAWKTRQTVLGGVFSGLIGAFAGKMMKDDLLRQHAWRKNFNEEFYRRYYGRGSRSGRARGPASSHSTGALKRILGAESSKTKKDVQKAYRNQAMKHHPDKGGDPSKMQKINDAYDEIKKTDWFKKLSYPFWMSFMKQASGPASGQGKGFTGTGKGHNPIGGLEFTEREGGQVSHGGSLDDGPITETGLLDRERNPRDFAHGETGPELEAPDGSKVRY